MNDEKDMNKMKLTDRFMIAMFAPGDYGKLLKEKTGRLIGYVAILIFLVTVARYIIPGAATLAGMGGIKGIINRELPEFSLKDGELTIDGKIEKNDEATGIYVLVDTDQESFSKEDIPEDVMDNVIEAVLVSKTNVYVYNEYSEYTGANQDIKFANMGNAELNNKILADMAPLFYVGFVFWVVFLYFTEVCKYLLWGLFFALFMTLYSNVWMHPVGFGKAYKTSMYAQTIGTLVYSVTCGFGNAMFMFAANFFQIILSFSLMRRALIPFGKPPVED